MAIVTLEIPKVTELLLRCSSFNSMRLCLNSIKMHGFHASEDVVYVPSRFSDIAFRPSLLL